MKGGARLLTLIFSPTLVGFCIVGYAIGQGWLHTKNWIIFFFVLIILLSLLCVLHVLTQRATREKERPLFETLHPSDIPIRYATVEKMGDDAIKMQTNNNCVFIVKRSFNGELFEAWQYNARGEPIGEKMVATSSQKYNAQQNIAMMIKNRVNKSD